MNKEVTNISRKVNVKIEHLDKDGNRKKLWNQFKWVQVLREKFNLGEFARIPFVTGYNANALRFHNLVTNAGLALVAGRINGSGTPDAATYIAVGTGTTSAAAGDTALETEIGDSGLSRAAGTVSLQTTTETNDTARVTKTFSVTGTKAVTEAGLLNDATTGTLLARQVFAAVNVVNTDSLAVTWDIAVS